jgi:superfamily II DNA helicase RecQ
MLAKVITLRFNELTGGFDDAPLREFVKDKEVLSLRENFFIFHDVPYLMVFVSYNLPAPVTVTSGTKKERDESWRELLTPADMPIFNTLRDWRNERSRREGIPPYIICTNHHLAQIVQKRVKTKTELGQIESFGKTKVERYGADIIALMTEHAPEQINNTNQENLQPIENNNDGQTK